MGYNTKYDLESENSDLVEIFREKHDLQSIINENGDFLQSCKWYEHETNLKDFSKLYPDILFTLQGMGEDNEDMWVKYFKNGKMQKVIAKITYDPFDETKLK